MNSPITGKPMKLIKEARELSYRKELFSYINYSFLCEDTKEQFTDTKLTGVNLNQVYNQYRQKYNIPFPEEIKNIREKYNLSARKMAEILGFGVNMYRNYEQGEVPNLSNAKLIRLAADTKNFLELVQINTSLKEKVQLKLINKIEELVNNERSHPFLDYKSSLLNIYETPNLNTGYRKLNLPKLVFVVKYFAEKLQPWKTQMNKLLFYSDFLMFKRSCFSITGISYRAIKMGPVPKDYDLLYSYLRETKKVQIQSTAFDSGAIGEQFLSENNDETLNVLSDEEISVIHQVEQKFKTFSTKEIIDYSHKEKAWLDNYEDKNLISYKYAFEIEI